MYRSEQNSEGVPPNRGVEYRWGTKKLWFLTDISSNISETIEHRQIVTMEL